MKTISLAGRTLLCYGTFYRARSARSARAVTPVAAPLAKSGAPALICLLALLGLALFSMSASCQTICRSPYKFTTLPGKPGALHLKPKSVAVDPAGNVYFADTRKHIICRLQPTGHISIIAGELGVPGSADGAGSQARFDFPHGIAIDAADNIFVADTGNNTIRRITPGGIVTTVAGLAGTVGSADGTGNNARFNYPAGLAVDRLGNIYVADADNGTIRKVTSNGAVTTIAGQAGVLGSADGKGATALFNFPIGIAVDGLDNIYVADVMNNAIRKVTTDGTVTTLAGRMSYTGGNTDATGSAARFAHPSGIVVDRAGNIYVGDAGNDTIRHITPGGVVTTLAGIAGKSGFADGKGIAVRFWHPAALALDARGNLYVTDLDNGAIRKGSTTISTNKNAALTFKTFADPGSSYRE